MKITATGVGFGRVRIKGSHAYFIDGKNLEFYDFPGSFSAAMP